MCLNFHHFHCNPLTPSVALSFAAAELFQGLGGGLADTALPATGGRRALCHWLEQVQGVQG